MSKKYFVSGIGTDVGKTIASAALVEALKADYWKPVQSGELENSDSMKIANLISNAQTKIHQETYRFKLPASPHLSANEEQVEIEMEKFKIPETDSNLIVEGAGGLLVPLSENKLIIDLIEMLKLPVILVARSYLGSINHTLLSIEAVKNRGIKLAGIVYSGSPNAETERIISVFSDVTIIGRLPEIETIDKEHILEASRALDLAAL
ncbi:MAG: dethiobiotin synthase [Crocinitomicaceae bacterium]|nr:dethiobiotin synthase [Crocinitomicaceae bacterium]|tara:strand:- start:23038 stop:23658 length:621 start_codon:yes stop_codon:yes gene_type:complete